MSWFRVGAVICFLAVALGAFGAHAVRQILEVNQSRPLWNTAVLYQFLHGLAFLVLSLHNVNRFIYYLFLAGIFLFSGSLYLLALIPQARDWLGPITPLGGLCFLAGWAWLIIAPTKGL